jgi:hypothetical protein
MQKGMNRMEPEIHRVEIEFERGGIQAFAHLSTIQLDRADTIERSAHCSQQPSRSNES